MKASSASLFLLASIASAISLDCSHVRVDGKKFNFEKLGGPHFVSVIDKDQPPSVHNTTWTIDICQPLKKTKEKPEDQCKTGTQVCGITTVYNPADDPDKKNVQVEKVISVAGNFHTSEGKGLDPKITRLKSTDSEAEGVEIEMHGGTYDKKNQKAVIRFECDKERTGNEGNEATESIISKLRKRDEDGDDNGDDKGDDGKNNASSLTFVSYGNVGGKDDTDVLRMNWRTKYACEDYQEDDDDDNEGGGSKKGGWGFFTWFIVLVFLGTAAYLIFGSWLNYNRYGARGWDLLPHGDTIRDIPYMVKDWSRKVVDTVSGSGSRGGYSAV